MLLFQNLFQCVHVLWTTQNRATKPVARANVRPAGMGQIVKATLTNA